MRNKKSKKNANKKNDNRTIPPSQDAVSAQEQSTGTTCNYNPGETNKDADEINRRHKQTSIYTSIAMVILTAAIAWYSIKLADSATKQTNAAEHALRSQRTQDSLSVASFHIQHRAFVVIENIAPVVFEPNKVFSISFSSMNIGNTPAYKVKSIINYSDAPLTDEEFAGIHPAIQDNGIIMGKYKDFPKISSSNWLLTQDAYNVIKSDSASIYVAIVLTYEDIFHESHYTHAYVKFVPKMNTFLYMLTHNHAD